MRQTFDDVNDEAEARKRGFPKGSHFKLLKFDIVLATEKETAAARAEFEREQGVKLGQTVPRV